VPVLLVAAWVAVSEEEQWLERQQMDETIEKEELQLGEQCL
jgi:hypothetical protein